MSNLYERCFIYSREQQERIIVANERAGRTRLTFGTVVVNGVPKTYTDMIISMDRTPFADAVLLIRGDVRKIKFTKHKFS